MAISSFKNIHYSFIVVLFYYSISLFFGDASENFNKEHISGFEHILDLLVYFTTLFSSAALFIKYQHFSRKLWLLICVYIILFVARNSISITELQEGFNLSPGFVLLTLLPFVFFRPDGESKYILYFIIVSVVLWLALIGARTAVLSILFFLLILKIMPILSKNKFRFKSAFVFTIFMIVAFYYLYLTFANAERSATIENTGFEFFNKRIGTRIEIWNQLVEIISLQPIFGYGFELSTNGLVPSYNSGEFTLARDNLSAHSLYIEILFRSGIVGLVLFLLFMYCIWCALWYGRFKLECQVSAAFILTALVFSTTGEYLILSTIRLYNGFAWGLIGIGIGSSVLQKNILEKRICKHGY